MRVPVVFQLSETANGGEGPAETVVKGDVSKLPVEFRYDTPPRLTSTTLPVYPYALLYNQQDGRAVVRYIIGKKGDVISTSITEASAPEFGWAVQAAVDCFTYEPAVRGGKPTETLLGFEQEFAITKDWLMSSREDAGVLALEKKNSPRIVKMRELDEPLKPTYQQPGSFPTCLDPAIRTGSAVVEFLVDEEGTVRLPRIVKATHLAFGYAAVQSVAAWQFEPPKRGGRAVIVRVRAPFEFSRPPAGAGKSSP